MANRYGWGDNEPKILPEAQNGDRTNLFGIKIKALFTDLFAKLNIDANKLDGVQAGAEKNKNAFAKIKVGSSLILADNQEDTFEMVPGSNVVVTPDAVNDKVTIGLPPSLDVNITGSANSAQTCNGCGAIISTELTNANEASNRTSGFYQTGANISDGDPAGASYAGIIQVSRNSNRICRLLLRGDLTQPVAWMQAFNEGTWGPLTRFVMEGDNITGNAASATKLATGRTIQTDLGSTSAPSFNGTANITPGVKGILPVARGGTGASALSGITVGNATKATQDSAGQQINSTYIKELSISGRTITYTKGNGSTGTISTPTLATLGGAPNPKTAAGVGQWIDFRDLVDGHLPSGGTWAYFCNGNKTSTVTPIGVAAGGTKVAFQWTFGFGWRIA